MHFNNKIDAALEGVGQYKEKGYFFQSGMYLRYDWKLDREDFGYPQPLASWKLPVHFQSGIDAAVNGQGAYSSKAYFFKGDRYARYDWTTNTVDLIDQSLANWRLPANFLSGVDAVLNGEGNFSGKTYLFKGDQYVRYDWNTDAIDVGPANLSAWHLPGAFGTGVQAAINGRASFAGKAYFFKGGEFVRYDWAADTPDPGYPHTIAGDWKHGVSIWANLDTALNVHSDARLREDDGSTLSLLAYPYGTTRGQAGWDVGLHFGDLARLATLLLHEPIPLPNFVCGNVMQDCDPVKPGQISRLGINAHGESGEVRINGNTNPESLTPVSLISKAKLQADLASIRDATDPSATILFFGCKAGNSLGGTALLSALSLFMPGRTIVAFSTIGFAHGGRQSRHGSVGFTEPGMRDTEFAVPASTEAEESSRYDHNWNNLDALPWASEFSPHAKVALNGLIIRGAEL